MGNSLSEINKRLDTIEQELLKFRGSFVPHKSKRGKQKKSEAPKGDAAENKFQYHGG